MKPQKEYSGALRRWIRPVAFGGLAGAVGCLLMLLLLAALLLTQDVPQTMVSPLSLVAAVTGAFIGGFTAARISGQNGWLIGALAGLLLFFVLLIAGGFSMLQNTAASHMWAKLAAMLVTAAVGGIVAVNLRRR